MFCLFCFMLEIFAETASPKKDDKKKDEPKKEDPKSTVTSSASSTTTTTAGFGDAFKPKPGRYCLNLYL